MKLTFLGTKAYIRESNEHHRKHSALLIEHEGGRVMVDCGEDWRGALSDIAPDAIILTHAHPDHAFGLADGAPCPVWATAESWEKKELEKFPIEDRRTLPVKTETVINGLRVTAFPVIHSKIAPAVALRIADGEKSFVYVPDTVDIIDRAAALADIDLYIGDGTTLTRPLVRQQNGQLFGHTTIRAQLGWCAAAGVPRVLFTHCGGEIVRRGDRSAGTQLHQIAREKGLENAGFAFDGMAVTV